MFLLDIEKAFDTVWHDGLLHKSLKLNIPINLLKLIKSYLSNRMFMVFMDDETKSSCQVIHAGVPQGSILGPYLFLLYLNGIPVQPRTSLACFADDTASFTSSEDVDLIISRLQLAIDELERYFAKWKFKLNAAKTEAILFTRQRQAPKRTLSISGHQIPWRTAVRYLGVKMDNKLNWSKHVADLRVKGAQAMGALSPILNRKSKLSPETKIRIYTTLVRPCITYACPVWSSTCMTNYQLLQIIQNKALKISFNTRFKTNLNKLQRKIKLPSILQYLLKLTKNFYTKNLCHKNPLISKICKTSKSDLPYIDKYGTYRLPHHYLLFPPADVTRTGEQAHNQFEEVSHTRP